ncbi:response regulator [Hoeflea olei]|uniref:Response regulatory domain-containing protein n=1 Tax=Hoeflea olei TaxID=1480615 RepID=A0A1C1YW82_9HYPH|nr:response regulator [Hoeflea olei]OCW57761.1 hypothetical protein AWJ14_02870 [Hoeflea olei]
MKQVLLIDDDVMEHKLLETFLFRRYGGAFELVWANTVSAAIEILRTRSFDAIFIDRILPPHLGARETFPLLAGHIGSSQVIYISSDTSSYQWQPDSNGVPIQFIDKLDMRDRIMNGLLDA